MKRKINILALLFLVLLINGCDSSDSEQSNHPPSQKEEYELVLEKRETLPVGFATSPSARLVSTMTGVSQDVTDQVSLTSSDPSVAHLSEGQVQAQSSGETELTATLTRAGVTYSSSSSLRVSEALVDTLTIQAPHVTLGVGARQQYTAIAQFDDGSTLEVTKQPNINWSVNSSEKASIESTTGLLTTISPGEVLVELRGQANGVSFRGSKSLTITTATVKGLSVTPSGAQLRQGMTQQYTATATYSDQTTNDVTNAVTWSVDAPQVASIDSSTGLLTAGTQTGNVSVTASFQVSGQTFSESVSATVDNNTQVSSFSITPSSASFPILSRHQLSAIALDELGNSYDVSASTTWSLDSSTYASIDEGGLLQIRDRIITTPLGVTATYQGKTATASILLTSSPLDRFVVSPQKVSLPKGLSKQLNATVFFESQHSLDFTSSSSLTWNTDNASIASVADGLVTAHDVGSAQIQVSGSYQGQAFSSSTEIEVTPAVVKNVVVSPSSSPPLSTGRSQQFIAKAFISDLTEFDITDAPAISWSSSDNTIADVDARGLVTAKSPGLVTITAAFDGLQNTVPLPVVNANIVEAISARIVTDGPSNLPLGAQANYFLELTDSQGATSLVRSASTFSYVSSDPTIASIDANSGLLTAEQVGGPVTISITGSIAGIQATDTSVTVSSATLQALELTPNNTQTRLIKPVNLTVTKTYSDGSQDNSLTDLAWQNSDPTIGNVDTNPATFTPSQTGLTTLSVTSTLVPSLVAESQIEVVAASLESFRIELLNNTPPTLNVEKPMRATGIYSDGSTKDITFFVDWSVTSPNIATINRKGVVTATALGDLTIVARYAGLQDQQLDTVVIPQVTSLFIQNSDLTLSPGASMQLIVQDQNGQDISDVVNYTSSDETIATVNSNGTVTALKAGSVKITATLHNLSDIVTLSLPTSVTSCGPVNSTANNTDGACLKVTSSADNTKLFTATPSSAALVALGYTYNWSTQALSVNSPLEGVVMPNFYIGFKGPGQPNDAGSYCTFLGTVKFLDSSGWRLPTSQELSDLISTKGPLGTNYRWPYPKGKGYRVSDLSEKTLHIQWGNELNENKLNAAPTSCVTDKP
ncbi:Ig-like domain-containing protein [Vibrio sp. CB1-14]|uniref:Ig-like domain-containing protein n=1 Tax=Vibrio chaetopteri TaxID=3016528 RepID=A0AAU8BRD1_9VIBR